MPDSSRPLQTAVLIVNYGTADMTAMAVDSVLRYHRDRLDVEIHVIDNASPGDDVATLVRHHAERGWGAQVVLHLEEKNHGFGCGNNVVLRQLAVRIMPPEFIFLLNPDAALESDAIPTLIEAMKAQPKIAFAGAGVRNADGSLATAAFRFPGIASTFVEAVNFGPLSRLCSKWLVPLPPDTPEGLVDWVSGAAVMIRSSALREVGLFDEDFFLYYEEVELMYRAAGQGWSAYFVPQARIVHHQGAATGMEEIRKRRARRPAYWYQSWAAYFDKTAGRSTVLGASIAWLAGVSINYLIAAVRRKRPDAPLGFFGDFRRLVLSSVIWRRRLGPRE